MRILLRFALSAAALYLTSLILNALGPAVGNDHWCHMRLSHHVGPALLAILGLALVNSLVRPVLGFFAMPLTFMTLGLSSLIINAALFWAVGYFTGGYDVGGWLGLLLGPIIMGFVTGVLSLFLGDDNK